MHRLLLALTLVALVLAIYLLARALNHLEQGLIAVALALVAVVVVAWLVGVTATITDQ